MFLRMFFLSFVFTTTTSVELYNMCFRIFQRSHFSKSLKKFSDETVNIQFHFFMFPSSFSPEALILSPLSNSRFNKIGIEKSEEKK